jgi:murein DD-endopeptidase MepM/ murein hydrolase activator NlpD
MEIISYNVTSLADTRDSKPLHSKRATAVAEGATRERMRYVPRIRTHVVYPAKAPIPDISLPFRRVAGGIVQYRLLLLTALAGAVLGMLMMQYDLYDKSFVKTLDINRFSTLETDALSRELVSFALPQSNSLDSMDELLAHEGTLPEFVFTNPVTFSTYSVRSGDTILGIGLRFGLKNMSTLISVNDIDNVRQLRAGQKLTIPSIDGIIYQVKNNDSLTGLSARYNITVEDILDVNDLASSVLTSGQRLFIPGVQLDTATLKKALGEQFMVPLAGSWRLTSLVGYRRDPFTGVRQYHNGIDMAAPQGTPIRATMGGTVVSTGYSNVYGNFVLLNHGNGYQSMYGHMSKILVRKGNVVGQGTQIGLVGSTGYSTGPHLHFTLYKNGAVIDPRTLIK